MNKIPKLLFLFIIITFISYYFYGGKSLQILYIFPGIALIVVFYSLFERKIFFLSYIISVVGVMSGLLFKIIYENNHNIYDHNLFPIEIMIMTIPFVFVLGVALAIEHSIRLIFYNKKVAQQVDAPEPATMVSPASRTPHRPAR